jgi:CopG family transcriptional regulator/antitoxin EndoAI
MAAPQTHEDTTVHRRINVTLSEETLPLLDRVAEKGDRSRLIDAAVRYYIDEKGRAELKKRLKAGAIRRAARGLALAEEWLPLEEEVWQNDDA